MAKVKRASRGPGAST